MNKFNRGIEKFWLYVCIVYAVFLAYEYLYDEIQIANFYLLISIFPIIMYLFRRYMRIKMEKNLQKSNKAKKSNKK